MFLQAYIPKLRSVELVSSSCAGSGESLSLLFAFSRIGDAYVAGVDKFAEEHDIP